MLGIGYRDAMAACAVRRLVGRVPVRRHGARPRVGGVLPAHEGRGVSRSDDRPSCSRSPTGRCTRRSSATSSTSTATHHRRLRNLSTRRSRRARSTATARDARVPRAAARRDPGGRPLRVHLAIAKPYPSLVIAEVMGAPLSDGPNCTTGRTGSSASSTPEPDVRARADRAGGGRVLRLGRRADRRAAAARTRATDLISALIQAEDGGRPPERRRAAQPDPQHPRRRRRHQPEPAGARLRLLAARPDQWELLRGDPRGLALAAVDEALRYEPITPFTAADHGRRDRVPRR